MRTCRLCDGEISGSYKVKEMLIGLRETFEYFLCSSRGCLQIAAVPSNLSKYYPQDYYSLQTPKRKKSRIIRDYIRSSVALYNIQGTGLVGYLLFSAQTIMVWLRCLIFLCISVIFQPYCLSPFHPFFSVKSIGYILVISIPISSGFINQSLILYFGFNHP